MLDDVIVNEIRRIKESIAARYNYDVRKIAQALREEQQKSGCKVISRLRQPRPDKTGKN